MNLQPTLYTLAWLLISQTILFAQPTTSTGKNARLIKDLVEKKHYEPPAFDDAFSEVVFNRFLQDLDPDRVYFLQSDIEDLSTKYIHEIDDHITNSTSPFFDEVSTLFNTRLKETEEGFNRIFDKGFDWKKIEFLDESYLNTDAFPTNLEAQKEKWRQILKEAVLDELFYGFYHDNAFEADIDSLLMHEKEAIETIQDDINFYHKTFLESPQGYTAILAEIYLDAIAQSVDPHTSYFSPVQEQKFEMELSRDNYAFGFSIEENSKGEVVIASLLPGSPAWASNQLNKDDVILEMKLGDGKKVDLQKVGIDGALLEFANSSAMSIWLKIRKLNGLLEEITLDKGIVYVDDDVIKNVILAGDQKIGYITLPDFYTDWGDEGTLGCANDVAKAIVKLQQENIEGLILDLRNNGGGSLKEAIDLAGIFINYGPLTIHQGKDRDPQSIKDFNKGAMYTGPLVILVNGASASASELLTAALQDYNRAIVVGSNTFGKATGQVILPLDENNPDEANGPGFLKITTSKFYRINLGTAQRGGIVPDVAIPDIYDIYDYRESSYENALSQDSVEKKLYFTPYPKLPNSMLAGASQNRYVASENGKQLVTLLDSIERANQNYIIPLEIKAYQQQLKKEDRQLETLRELLVNENPTFQATNNQYDQQIMELNEYRSNLNKEYLIRLNKDIYIQEAYSVLSDYIKFKE